MKEAHLSCGISFSWAHICAIFTAFLIITLLPIKCKIPGPNLSPYDGNVSTAGHFDQPHCLLRGGLCQGLWRLVSLALILGPSKAGGSRTEV